MLLNFALLILGFVLLIKGADFLVQGASALARKFHLSELIIGLTIVALGTSSPELIVSLVSAAKGYNDVTLGNVIGSNIFNLMLILGLSAVVRPITVQRSTIIKEIPFSIIAALVLLVLANDHLFTNGKINQLSFIDGLIMACFFIFFMFYVYNNMKSDDSNLNVGQKPCPVWKSLLLIAGGLTGLIFGGRISVNNAVAIAHALHISERIIGLTIVAAGTSLPELATSAVAAYRRNADIAVGNVVGSNIFNIFFVLPISAMIHPLPYEISFNTDLTALIGGTMLLLFFTYSGRKAFVDRWEGGILVAGFFVYYVFLVFPAT